MSLLAGIDMDFSLVSANSIPRIGFAAGPDVTPALTVSKAQVYAAFKSSSADRHAACKNLSEYKPEAGLAWDLEYLYQLGSLGQFYFRGVSQGDGLLTRTVQFRYNAGPLRIYYAGEVNYAMYGWANKLCYDEYKLNPSEDYGAEWELGKALDRVVNWKAMMIPYWGGGWGRATQGAVLFTTYGYSDVSPESAALKSPSGIYYFTDPGNVYKESLYPVWSPLSFSY